MSPAAEPTGPVPVARAPAGTVYWPGNAAGYAASEGNPPRLLWTEKWVALVAKGASLPNSSSTAPSAKPVRLALGWYGSGRARLVPFSCVGIALSPGSGVYRVSGTSGPVSGR